MPLPWLASGLSLAIAAKSAVKSSTPTVGVPDDSEVVVLELDDDFEPPPHAATTKTATAARPAKASHLHAERILPPSLALGRNCGQGYSPREAGSRPTRIGTR